MTYCPGGGHIDPPYKNKHWSTVAHFFLAKVKEDFLYYFSKLCLKFLGVNLPQKSKFSNFRRELPKMPVLLWKCLKLSIQLWKGVTTIVKAIFSTLLAKNGQWALLLSFFKKKIIQKSITKIRKFKFFASKKFLTKKVFLLKNRV